MKRKDFGMMASVVVPIGLLLAKKIFLGKHLKDVYTYSSWSALHYLVCFCMLTTIKMPTKDTSHVLRRCPIKAKEARDIRNIGEGVTNEEGRDVHTKWKESELREAQAKLKRILLLERVPHLHRLTLNSMQRTKQLLQSPLRMLVLLFRQGDIKPNKNDQRDVEVHLAGRLIERRK